MSENFVNIHQAWEIERTFRQSLAGAPGGTEAIPEASKSAAEIIAGLRGQIQDLFSEAPREHVEIVPENPPAHSLDVPGLESAEEFLVRLNRVARGDARKARAWMHAKFEELKRLHWEGKISPQTMQAYLAIFLQDRKVAKQAAVLQEMAQYYLVSE